MSARWEVLAMGVVFSMLVLYIFPILFFIFVVWLPLLSFVLCAWTFSPFVASFIFLPGSVFFFSPIFFRFSHSVVIFSIFLFGFYLLLLAECAFALMFFDLAESMYLLCRWLFVVENIQRWKWQTENANHSYSQILTQTYTHKHFGKQTMWYYGREILRSGEKRKEKEKENTHTHTYKYT